MRTYPVQLAPMSWCRGQTFWETKGGLLGRGECAPQAQTHSVLLLLRVKREALTLHASPAACVTLQDERVAAPHADLAACATPAKAEGHKENTERYIQGLRRLQSPFRAMTPRTSSVAFVDPCEKAAAVVGTYAGNIEAEE